MNSLRLTDTWKDFDVISTEHFRIKLNKKESGALQPYVKDLLEKAGYEFSAVAGMTYNLRNTTTDYQNGIDAHIDWGASRFLWKIMQQSRTL